MARTNQLLLAGMAGLIAVAGSARPADAQIVKVTVRVENQANLPDDLLADAESIAAAIYANAGVDIAFVRRGDADFMVKLLSRSAEDRMRPNADAMGFVPCSESDRGHIAYVFPNRVDRVAERYTAARYVVLAVAMAHEVGHLMLPLNAHSKTGIMKATSGQLEFQRAVRGQLLFTPEQIAQIHTRLMSDAPR